jgi:zinc finger protein 830
MSSNPDSNIRSLLRKELSTRRITHPHASYTNTKSNLLSCNVCHLIIKSESLWEGHLRSANHRRNVQKLPEQDPGTATIGGRKRKANEVDSDIGDGSEGEAATGEKKRKAEDTHDAHSQADERKKTKSESLQPPPTSSSVTMSGFVAASTVDPLPIPGAEHTSVPVEHSKAPGSTLPATQQPEVSSGPFSAQTASAPPQKSAALVDEEEWAAFERDVVPLAHVAPLTQTPAATITAAPLSASELAAQRAAEERTATVRSREEEAEAEREEEGRRMEEEFEVQEEMEGRARRLRERLREIKARERAEEGRMDEMGGLSQHQDARSEEGPGRDEAMVKERQLDGNAPEDQQEEDDSDDDDDDDLDEFDEWGLR